MRNVTTNVVIVGGGTAGWMAAAAISKTLGVLVDVTLIESKEIATIGVGESTIPPLKSFHQLLNINEADFMRATNATFKMGVQFEGWGSEGSDYIHSFGITGQESWMAGFQNLWLLAREKGLASDFGEYCFELVAAKQAKFALRPKSHVHYAYHLDAAEYVKYLKNYCKETGVKHIQANVVDVAQDTSNGFIESVTLDGGEVVGGDLFLDCTGFHGLLIEKTMNTGYEDWGHWLPCDRALVVQTPSAGALLPYTRAIAHDAGWRWRIPLQNRIGNGFVYSSKYLADEVAHQNFLASIEGVPLSEPRLISYRTGRRLKAWNKNCIALGLSSGFIEPLESTGIHLFMTGITRLLQLFPCGKICPSIVREYNDQTRKEFEHIRDFIILHYHVSQREDSRFWYYCRNMDLPDQLSEKIQLFRESARIFKEEGDPFRVESWAQVMIGQGLLPESYHKVGLNVPDERLENYLRDLQTNIAKNVESLPSHEDFIQGYCKTHSSR